MADNVPLSLTAVTVATRDGGDGVQHQKVVNEFLTAGGIPLATGVGVPQPIADDLQAQIQTAMLIEMRVLNELLYVLTQTEVEPLEALRAKYSDYPITI
jgi:hypothetical protein